MNEVNRGGVIKILNHFFMLKKLILTFLVLVFSLFSQAITFADSIPVEDIFSDINSDYKYLNELQTLYDGGMISPDSE
jgi:ABC-type long-subunit fatty acid transport system fused permease/ATPase subunit